MTRAKMRRLLEIAREAELKKRNMVDTLFAYLENNLDVNLEDIPNNSAENADNLAEAIMCHVNYGECDIEDLLDDITKCFGIIPEKRKAGQ